MLKKSIFYNTIAHVNNVINQN